MQIDNLLSALICSMLVVVVTADLSAWLLFPLAACQGWTNAGMLSGLRALLVVAVPGEQLHRAHFVESSVNEVCYAVGPVLAGALMLLGNVTLALAAIIGLQCTAALALASVGALRPEATARSKSRTALALYRRPDIRRLTILVIALGTGFQILEANVPQRMSQFDLAPGAAGWFLGIFAVGSCTGGLFVSFRPLRRRDNYLRPALLLIGFAALNVPVVLAGEPTGYGVSLGFSTLLHVPLVGFLAGEYEARLDPGRRGEGFAYMVTGTALGGSAGNLANGLLIGPLAARVMPLIAIALFLSAAAALLAFDVRWRRGH